MWEIDTFSNYEDLQNLLIISNIRRQWEISKHHQSVFCNFLLDFNRLLKSIKKRPQQTATTTIYKGNPPKLTKRKKNNKNKQMSSDVRQKKLPSNPFLFAKKSL